MSAKCRSRIKTESSRENRMKINRERGNGANLKLFILFNDGRDSIVTELCNLMFVKQNVVSLQMIVEGARHYTGVKKMNRLCYLNQNC